MAKKSKSKEASGESKVFALIAYVLGIVGFILVFLVRRKDNYAMFHAKQALVLCITWIVVYLAGMVIPFIGWFIIWPLGNLLMVVLWVIGLINAVLGKQKKLPIIGKYADKIKL